jgi:hypothetical protein
LKFELRAIDTKETLATGRDVIATRKHSSGVTSQMPRKVMEAAGGQAGYLSFERK